MLSGNNNVYEHEVNLNEKQNKGFITVLSSGTLALDKNVSVEIEIEIDEKSLNEWNYRNFDIKTEEYAKLLSPERYEIEKNEPCHKH